MCTALRITSAEDSDQDAATSAGRPHLHSVWASGETADKAVHWLMLLLPSLVVIGELLYTIIGFVGFRALVKRIGQADFRRSDVSGDL